MKPLVVQSIQTTLVAEIIQATSATHAKTLQINAVLVQVIHAVVLMIQIVAIIMLIHVAEIMIARSVTHATRNGIQTHVAEMKLDAVGQQTQIVTHVFKTQLAMDALKHFAKNIQKTQVARIKIHALGFHARIVHLVIMVFVAHQINVVLTRLTPDVLVVMMQ
jgi:hypothetical protein